MRLYTVILEASGFHYEDTFYGANERHALHCALKKVFTVNNYKLELKSYHNGVVGTVYTKNPKDMLCRFRVIERRTA